MFIRPFQIGDWVRVSTTRWGNQQGGVGTIAAFYSDRSFDCRVVFTGDDPRYRRTSINSAAYAFSDLELVEAGTDKVYTGKRRYENVSYVLLRE